MTSIDPAPIDPDDIGRDNDVDGTLGSEVYISEVKVINLTPHEVSEIKTSVITLEQDIFPVPKFAGDPDTAPISVFSDDVTRGYVQWEPMGDLYAATELSPLGSYKYLRVKWDCYIPAGEDDVDYTSGAATGRIVGPYEYYKEKTYVFRKVEPQNAPSFTLTNGVLSALGFLGCDKPTSFEFSAHGYVNSFNFHNGLYGQDKQTAFPTGSALLPASREVIYDRHFAPVGSINEPPQTQGGEALAKEYMVHGRIVPELDYDGAGFDVIQEGTILPIGSEASSIYSTSGRDAPPFWYNFHYELQHNKNIIPFTFMWGVSLPTYDAGTYDPNGPTIDPQDKHGRITGNVKYSSNHGQRRRSQDWVDYFKQHNVKEASQPNIFHSQDDITFSVIGPDTVCQASSVNVCAVYSETAAGGLNKTVLNWFDKRNQSWYDVEVFGYNFLPSYSCWVLRGCLHLNSNYLPNISLSTRDTNSQASNRLEKTWAIDQNFQNRDLFTAYKYAYPTPPQDFLNYKGYENVYQTMSTFASQMWDSTVDVEVTYTPGGATRSNDFRGSMNPFFGAPDLEPSKSIGYVKNLREPWASNVMGLAYRPGITGEQPGFNYQGIGAGLAMAGHPDARFLEANIDLEWNRNTIEATRDGQILDQFADPWITKRFVPDFDTLRLPALNDAVRTITNNPSYNEWLNGKTIDSPEFAGGREMIDTDSVFGYTGTNPAMSGSNIICGFHRGFDPRSYGVDNRGKTDGFARFCPGIDNSKYVIDNKIGHPVAKHQNAYGYPNQGLFCNDSRHAFTVAHLAFGHMLSYAMISGDKITLDLIDHFIRTIIITHGDLEHSRRLFDRRGSRKSSYQSRIFRVGRQEGRAIHAVIGGISVTNNRELAEQALYKYGRRFWNNIHVTNFESYPTGYPGKPWRTIWYPPWGGGLDLRLDANGIPQEVDLGVGFNVTYNELYRNHHGEFADLALCIYNTKGVRINEINPTFVSGNAGNAASWNYTVGSGRPEPPIWMNKYDDLSKSSNFPALGLSAVNRVPGGSEGSVVTSINYRIKYRHSDGDNDPFRSFISDPTCCDPTKTTSSLPGATVPTTLSESAMRGTVSQSYVSQSYQQSLLYPYINPLPELLQNYSTIFRGRHAEGFTPYFPARSNSYSILADELEDTSNEVKNYFVRVARSLSKQMIMRVHENSQVAAGKGVITYILASYSPSKHYEQFLPEEKKITLDADGEGQFPTITEISYVKNGVPLKARFTLAEDAVAGAYITSVDRTLRKGKLISGTWGTAVWATNALLWSWDILRNYGDLTDARNLIALDELKEIIEDWYGTEPFDLDKNNNFTDLRNDYYPRLWGEFGFAGVGANPSILDGKLGDYEVLPWISAATDNIWKDRSINLTLKVIQGLVKGSSVLDTNIEVIRNQTSNTWILEADGIIGQTTLSGVVERSAIRRAYTRDLVNESFYPMVVSPTITSTGGGGGASTWILDADLSGQTSLAVNLTMDYVVPLELNTSMALATNFTPVLIIPSIYNLHTGLESEINLGVQAPFSVSGSTNADLDSFNVFVKMPDFHILGSSELSAQSLPIQFSPPFTVIGSTEINSESSNTIDLGLLSISGALSSDGNLELLVIEGDIRMQSQLDSIISVIAGAQRGIAGDRDVDISLIENNISQSQYVASVSSANAFYAGIRSKPLRNFETNLFKEIQQRTVGDNKVSEIYKETLKYLLNVFSTLVYINDLNEVTKIPCWHGSSERAIAKLKQESNIILPIMSIYRVSNTSDDDRRRSASTIVYDKYWDTEKQRAVRIASLAPAPINITYRLNVWTKYQEDMDHITEQVLRSFNPDIEIKTSYNSTTKAFLIEESDSSEVNIAEGQDRLLRKTFNFVVESYIPNPKYLITNTGKIEAYNAEIHIPIK